MARWHMTAVIKADNDADRLVIEEWLPAHTDVVQVRLTRVRDLHPPRVGGQEDALRVGLAFVEPGRRSGQDDRRARR